MSEFEYWSQLCLRKFFASNVVSKSGFRFLRRPRGKHLIVSGRIGSGKTETASYLADSLHAQLISSGRVLQTLMGSPPLQEIGRECFQKRALSFITSADGPSRLAAAVAEALRERWPARCIIDGIRHISTFEALKKIVSTDIIHIHVSTPPDVAYEMYRLRESNTLDQTYRNFLKVYDAAVEQEVSSLGRAADIYIYNAFGLDAFRRTLDTLATQL